jgi:nicotinamide-nucleotide amidase
MVDMTLFIGKNDETISRDIKETIKNYQNIIIATAEGFELVGKILSTQTSDTLVHKHNMLLPSKSLEIEDDSYKLESINVLRINVCKKIPKILLHSYKESGVFLFCDDDEVKRFEKLAQIFEVECLGVQIIEGLWHYSLVSQNEIGIQRLLKEAREMITHKILIGDDLSSIIAQILIEHNKTITFAESCTGGRIASALTKNSGVSSIFKGSIVSYANEVKTSLVGVREQTLEKFGAVSRQTVSEMLDGVRKEFDSDFALAVSGVAGPDGGSREKPVGTVYVGVKNRENESVIKRLALHGDRIYIQQSSVKWALKLLVELDEKLFFKFVPKSLDK